MNLTKISGIIARTFVYLFLMCPLGVVICTAFSNTNRVVFPPRGFTLKWFDKAFHSAEFTNSLLLSIRIAVVSVIIACVLGTMVSLWFWKSDSKVKGIFETIFLSPIVIPTIISAVAFLQYFVLFSNLFTNYWKLCITYSIIEMPYVIRTVTANLVGLETSFEEASLVLGATPVKTLFNVTLPCIKQGIIGGAVFSFVVAFDECVIILFMKSAKTVTFPLRLYSYITESFTPLISAYATLFIIVAAVVIYIVERKIGLSKLY
ncbi:MAG TPA: ABC transporter permease [Clostridia bacterium]|nr:ABC transporter permease [Clostridia bacterium]